MEAFRQGVTVLHRGKGGPWQRHVSAAVCLQGRMTLLLGPPGAGKTTLLKALAGKLQRSPDLKVRHYNLLGPPPGQYAASQDSWRHLVEE